MTRPVQMTAFPDHAPERPVGPILASVQTGTNADLIAAVAPLYLTGSVLDVTYGEGKWWDRFTPEPFTFHDLHKVDGVDFTALPEPDRSVDTVCFDPPYVLSGGESTGRLREQGFQSAYGIGHQRMNNKAESFDAMLRAGLAECARVSRGWVLVKCMEFASGGFQDVPYRMRRWGEDIGLRTHDVIVHHTGHGPGGHNIFVTKRARRHHSYLLVFEVRP